MGDNLQVLKGKNCNKYVVHNQFDFKVGYYEVSQWSKSIDVIKAYAMDGTFLSTCSSEAEAKALILSKQP